MSSVIRAIVETQQEIDDKTVEQSSTEQKNINARLDNLYFKVVSGSTYDAMSSRDSSCIYVVSRTGTYELYKGDIRIMVGQGARYDYGIVVKIAEGS